MTFFYEKIVIVKWLLFRMTYLAKEKVGSSNII